jgi:hypothetical protein
MDWGARLGVKMNRIKEENSMECERTHRTSQVSKTESRNTTLDSLVQKSRKMHKKKRKTKEKRNQSKEPGTTKRDIKRSIQSQTPRLAHWYCPVPLPKCPKASNKGE